MKESLAKKVVHVFYMLTLMMSWLEIKNINPRRDTGTQLSTEKIVPIQPKVSQGWTYSIKHSSFLTQ